MPFIEVRGLRVYYERRGQGPPLLIFNGSGADLRRKPNVLDGPLADPRVSAVGRGPEQQPHVHHDVDEERLVTVERIDKAIVGRPVPALALHGGGGNDGLHQLRPGRIVPIKMLEPAPVGAEKNETQVVNVAVKTPRNQRQ